MTRTALQTHTLRPLEEPIDRKLDRAVDAGYEGVQFTPDLGHTTPANLLEQVRARELEIAGCHVDRELLEDDYEEAIEIYRTLDCSALVISSYDPEAFESEAGIERAVSHLSELADRLAEDGFTLHYHNHYFEFTDLGDRTGYEVFADLSDGAIRLEVDTGLAFYGGADPAALIDRYADRIDLVHLTDTIPGSDETVHAELGSGEVDLRACVERSAAANVEWLIYENGRTDDPATSIVDAIDVMSELLES
ncbi:sugar phosphate isomerase/epimerase [Natronoglomus mannanivorans]|uniref:Sugar phosphate isomerase/epimerase n=1 Tax=Natronoglomus mannanivorans TaxID=2979990 RepID=A0AAP2Z0Q2_9EURY|nr:sugar phosphate isomerase/epimerase [Halobacteria archaeon AArc-xg1-1]